MNSDQIFALIGACLLAFIVRVFNVVVEWLSRVLGVDPPDPIGSELHVDQHAPTVIKSEQEAPDTGY